MKLDQKKLFDDLMVIVNELTKNARKIHDKVENIQNTGNRFERMECSYMLGEAKGATDAAKAVLEFAGSLIRG